MVRCFLRGVPKPPIWTNWRSTSTLPPSPELEAVEDEEMAGWVKEQQTSQPSLRLYRGSPGDILVMARTAAPSFPTYYPRELNMDDEC